MPELCGLEFSAITEDECVERVISRAAQGVGGWVVTPNVDILRQCSEDEELRALVAGADEIVADGMPLIWASRLQRTPLPERVAGSHLISSLSAAAARAGLSVFLLGGGTETTAMAAAAYLRQRHEGLVVAGTFFPEFGFERSPERVREIHDALVAAGPDIVFVALGFPKAERLIARLREARPTAWWVGVGISFSFLIGEVRRAPRWMQVTGLEWVHRLVQEPLRLGKRYLVHGIPFALRLLGGSLRKRWRP